MGIRTVAAVAAGLSPALITSTVDIPPRAVAAYVHAAAVAPCPVDPRLLAGIAWVESRHGTIAGGVVGDDGRVSVAILGPPLDGTAFQRITDTDNGRYDGDPDVDRAVGPFQFIPGTWAVYGAGDPQDMDDAAAAAARLLCANGVDRDRDAAVFSYNHDRRYVADVLAYADGLPALDDDVEFGEPERERRLSRAVNAVFQATAVRWWLGVRTVLTPAQVKTWDRVDGWLFGDVAPPTVPTPVNGFTPEFSSALAAFMAAAPGTITITSGFRTVAEQEQLWQQALATYEAPEVARQWVAPAEHGACSSMHCKGVAADLAFSSEDVEAWAHANAERFGLWFPMAWESWHVELVSTRQQRRV